MGRFLAAVYDGITRASEEACLRQWREALLHDLSGRVLEVGAGTGANLSFYPLSLTRLVLSEPDQYMRRTLVRKLSDTPIGEVEVVDGSLERLPFDAGEFDAVVGTLVLCSVPSLDQALREMHRVLKPGGRYYFIEHVAAENRPRRLRWQRRIEPIWKRIAGGCHLTRKTADAIKSAGFSITTMERESMRKAMPLVRPTIRGVAVRA